MKRVKAQILEQNKLFYDPQYSDVVEKILEQEDDTERLCIVDEVPVYRMFVLCRLEKETLDAWRMNWQGNALGNFANAVLNALETKSEFGVNAVGQIRATMQAFQRHEKDLISQMSQVNVQGRVVERSVFDAETRQELSHFGIEFEGGAAYIPISDNETDRLIAQKLPVFSLHDFEPNEEVKIPMSMTQAINIGILNVVTVENIKTFPTVYRNPNWTFWHQLKHFFAYYTRDADAPMLWNGNTMTLRVPPVLHPSVKRLMFMSSTFSEQDLHRVFPNEEIEVHHIKPTAWVKGNRVFQIQTGIYSRQTLLNYDTDWDVLGMSKTGQQFLLGIKAEIEKDPSIMHAIITERTNSKSFERFC